MFLLPIIAGYSAYNLATTKSGDYEASGGDRKIDCYNIWEKIVTGPGTGSIQEGQAAATRLKSGYQDRLTTIDTLSKEMDAAWTGKSAEAAQQSGAHPLRAWMEDSGKKLVDSDKYLGEQNTAFTTVKAKVQQVPKDPPKNNLLNSITPWTTDTDRAIRDYNQKGQANVDAFNEYFKASSENGKKLPTYSKMEGQNTNVDVNGGGNGKDKDKDGNGNGQGDRNGHNGMPGISTPPGSMPPGGMPSVPGSNMPGIGTPGSNLPGSNLPGSNMPGSNIPGSNLPGSNLPGGQYNPNIPGSNYKPPSWDDGTSASGYTPPKIPGAGGFGPGGGGGGGGGFGGTDIPGAGGFGPDGGFGAGFGPGGSSGAALPGNAGAMGGAGMGGGAAGSGSGSGAGRGAGGMMGGMGGMGAGGAKGKGGEDEERSAKFLVGDDPNEIFGTDELTAPPVIGE
ncbi:hypothetical protein DL991_01210 [Amycolatopsis sp. WAC 01375]|uniref:PPE domain-containing protein n=1 Tax=Amycolatopsis sp. WAC 01375 TaxID=2203194 RepID=UPI000F7ABA0D|nr:PPE domain-containing protein [Amycolatopsis sp. WAC 01375]RSM84136.1 hypothetical protein DL991_01210 [Amycolatopsis sp. WAC 01375]